MNRDLDYVTSFESWPPWILIKDKCIIRNMKQYNLSDILIQEMKINTDMYLNTSALTRV